MKVILELLLPVIQLTKVCVHWANVLPNNLVGSASVCSVHFYGAWVRKKNENERKNIVREKNLELIFR
jgi:hypothetical protein